MNDSDQKHIAAQALKALQLRRQLDRGEVTHEEYVIRLNALQPDFAEPAASIPLATAELPFETAVSSRSTLTERPALMSALEVLRLRRRLDNGELTQQEYQAQLQSGLRLDQNTSATRVLRRTAEPSTAVPISSTREIAAPEMLPVRYMAMKCPGCGADLRVHDQTFELQCIDCGADVVVERENCTISLRLLDENTVTREAGAHSSSAGEVAKLQAEAAMLITVKRVAGVLGFLSTAFSASAGIADMAAQRPAMATSVLLCGSALLGMVVCIARHSSNVRAELTRRIRALTPTEE